MVDIAVKSGAAWTCHTQGRQLADVLRPVHIGNEEELSQSEGDETNRWEASIKVSVENVDSCFEHFASLGERLL